MSVWPDMPEGAVPPALELGFTPEPSDTFMFHALLHGGVRTVGLGPVQSFMAGPEELSQRALDPTRSLAVTRLSVPAMARAVDRFAVLCTGAVMGYGLGPRVIRRADGPGSLEDLAGRRVAVPGDHTTAWLLARIFGPEAMVVVPTPMERIAATVRAAEVDAGVMPTAGVFNLKGSDLETLADLGDTWEAATDLPLPLGLVCVRRDLSGPVATGIADAIRASVQSGLDHPGAAWDYIRGHCRGMDEEVCRRQIHLYINDHALSIGHLGRRAVEEMLARGRAAGMLPEGRSPWRDPD